MESENIKIAERQTEKKQVNALAMLGFLTSLLSILLGIFYCIVPLISVVLSVLGIIDRKSHFLNGLSYAGLIIGAFSLTFWFLTFILI